MNKMAVPVININGSLGRELNESRDNYTIDFALNQTWDPNVESYNIIGQLNCSDPQNNTKMTLIQSLYDSVWDQGSADSAIAAGMVLSLAKYMKQLENQSIFPKNNVRFILYGGEEHGFLGAAYYSSNLSNQAIPWIIDLNQLGFRQGTPSRSLVMNVATNTMLFKPFLKQITDVTDYEEREKDNTTFRLSWVLHGGPSDVYPFCKLIGVGGPTTVLFLKDHNWTRHHCDGENHTKGDTMDYYYSDDINLTMEMIWNTTRYIAYDPDSWLDNVSYTYTDDPADDNPDNDTVNITFDINTTFPEDKVTAILYLIPQYISNPLHPAYPILHRYHTQQQYIVTPQGTHGSLTLQLPKDAPQATYRISLVLLNSTGDTRLNTANDLRDNIHDFFDFLATNEDFNYQEKFNRSADDIASDFSLDIQHYLEHNFTDDTEIHLLIDFLTLYVLNEDKNTTLAPLSPPNDPPAQPAQPQGPLFVYPRHDYTYTTNTTDPNQDNIEYKWRFHLGDLFKYNAWTPPSSSGTPNAKTNSWDVCGWRWVFVKARDTYHSPNVQSPYSTPILVTVLPGSHILSADQQLVNEQVQFTGSLTGAQPVEWSWDLGSGWEHNRESNPTKTYTLPGTYTVQLNVTDTQSHQYLSSKTVAIKRVIANFTGNAGKPNETLWFNDTSRLAQGYTVTNRTWTISDGTTVYTTQNLSHIFQTPGVYNVTLTVTDQAQSCYDVCTQTCHIEDTPPVILDVTSVPIYACPDETVLLYADVIDASSGIQNVQLNISLPNGTYQIISMEPSEEGPFDYDYDYTLAFTDTDQIGDYFYTITVEDNAGNIIHQGGFSFTVSTLAFNPSTPYSEGQSENTIPVDLYSSAETTQHYAFTDFDNDVTVWMPMDVTTPDGDPQDMSSNQNNVIAHGGACQMENGFFGKGFYLDGADDYLEIDPASLLMFNASRKTSWSLWVSPEYTTEVPSMGLLSKASCKDSAGFNILLNMTETGFALVLCAPDQGTMRYSTSMQIPLDRTSGGLLTVVYNGSGLWNIFVDGAEQGTISFSVASDPSSSYLLGAARNPSDDTVECFLRGIVDDLIMFERGVQPDEVQSLYNASASPYAHEFTSLQDGDHSFVGCAGYQQGSVNCTETRQILIDSTAPAISMVTNAPETVGFGGSILINASVLESGSGLLLAAVNITSPNGSSVNTSMVHLSASNYQFNFSDTWWTGRYNYTVWAVDNLGNTAHSATQDFYVNAHAAMTVATTKDSYGPDEYINVTDPPQPPSNYTLVGRGLEWDKYYDAATDKNVLEVSAGPIIANQESFASRTTQD